MSSPSTGWPALLAATGPVLPWGAVAAAGGAALAVTALPAVLPPEGDGVVLVLAVLVLASGCAVAGEDPAAREAGVAPVPVRRRLLARLLLVLPVSGAALAGMAGVAALAGTGPGSWLVPLWAAVSAIATAVGVAAQRSTPDVPGPVAAVVVLGGGLVLVATLPASVVGLPPWDSAVERVGWALVASALLLLAATRDPGARR